MRDDHMRRPGEGVFSLVLVAVSAFLFWTAYGISGFEELSSPGALPMAASGTMLAASFIIAAKTFKAPLTRRETFRQHILPPAILIAMAMIAAYAVLLRPLGFLPTSFLFLLVLVRILGKRNVMVCAAVSAACVLLIYLVFRIIFTVIMPEGIVPEREILAYLGTLMPGGR